MIDNSPGSRWAWWVAIIATGPLRGLWRLAQWLDRRPSASVVALFVHWQRTGRGWG